MAERQFGPYKLVRQIAVGGMAEIHLAKAAGIAGFEKYVALKMIHPNFAEDDQFIQMLVDEAKIAVQLTHGNIAQTFDLGRVGETYYITMEYVDGADLYKILRRASERDLEMPLDVCAFIGKEVSSALDHAHRKRDHAGKSLGIVHRDVSPQNVLVSYSGEVKLVDFGIAKATMKVRQTAVGVIKGKYYYMSPEQAWGDPIDHRSDIFSAGIVLYEMITGQMMYLEEDLHKLLEMARRADIPPPSKLRRGVPPQLERIVMHALAKVPGERYQTAGDLATDLERFLHAYSPVFTAPKLSSLLRQVVGEPIQVPDDSGIEIEFRDGVMSTHPLADSELAHAVDAEELRDENSVLFRVAQPAAPVKPRKANEETRQLDEPAPPNPLHDDSGLLTPEGDKLGWDDAGPGEPTDELDGIAERTVITGAPGMTGPALGGFMMDVAGDDQIEATLITAVPTGPGFFGEPDSTAEPGEAAAAAQAGAADDDEDGPTLSRNFTSDPATLPSRPQQRPAPPAALAARIHAPAVSELRKPRPSRRTPPGGALSPPVNVLQAIVSSRSSEPMPVPRAPAPPAATQASSAATLVPGQPLPAIPPPLPMRLPPVPPPPHSHAASLPTLMPADAPHATLPPPMMAHASHASGLPTTIAMQAPLPHEPYGAPFPVGTPGQPSYAHDASGLPFGIPTPPGVELNQAPQYAMPHPGYDPRTPQPGYPPLSPNALYQFQPPPQQPLSLTGQMRLFEIDEIPAHYKIMAARRRLFTYILSGILAVSVAAGVTFLIIRATRDTPPITGSLHLASVPAGAEVMFDGTLLTEHTPLTIDLVPVGTRHRIAISLPHYKQETQDVDIPKNGHEQSIMVQLTTLKGTILVNTVPAGADIWINGQVRGVTPTKISEVDIDATRSIELRHRDFPPHQVTLKWQADGVAAIDYRFSH